jgi:hypothetical protein
MLIDVQIAMTQNLEGQGKELQFIRYFDKSSHSQSSRRHASTGVLMNDGSRLISDANIVISQPSESLLSTFFTLEVARGRDINRIMNQIDRHLIAMKDGNFMYQQ